MNVRHDEVVSIDGFKLGVECLTKTWQDLHLQAALVMTFPGDNEICTITATQSIAIESHCVDDTVPSSQKRLMSFGASRSSGIFGV